MELRYLLLLYLSIVTFIHSAQVTITGYAPQFQNQQFHIWKYSDFLSGSLQEIQETVVNEEGIFTFKLPIDQIEKLVVGNMQLTGYLYVQPKSRYNIEFIADQPQHKSYNIKEEVELTFLDLDSNDINYKILGLHAWLDNNLADIFVERDNNPGLYASKIIVLKKMLYTDILLDTAAFFSSFMRYTIANDIDNQGFLGAPSTLEKYQLYLEKSPIRYDNDVYMDFFKSFYDQYLSQIDSKVSDELFAAFAANSLNASDSILSTCPYLSNPELRSLVRIYILKQALSDDFLPKSVIRSNLQHISANAVFPYHRLIAANICSQVELIQVGNTFIFDSLKGPNETVILSKVENKFIYLHAFNPSNTNAINELAALKKLHKAYGSKVEFITIYVQKEILNSTEKYAMESIEWSRVGFTLNDPIWANLGIRTFPYYILIDRDFNVAASPALSPTPNGKYETIEKTFFDLSKP